MTKDICITITSVCLDEAGHETTTTHTLRGQHFLRGNSRFLLFEEKDPESDTPTKNTLKLTDSLLELSRSGALRCRMVFEAGKTHRTSYMTPYGSLLLEICTEELSSHWSDHEGFIRLSYSLYVRDTFLSRNKLLLQIKIFSESV